MATPKTERTTAKGRFTRKLNILNGLLEKKTKPTTIEDVEVAFTDLKDAWQRVEEKHDSYVNSLPEGDATALTEADTWIEDVEKEYNATRKGVLNFRSKMQHAESSSTARAKYSMAVTSFEKIRSDINNFIRSKYLPETLIQERTLLVSHFGKL